jgi:hypothetical protein
MGEWKLHDYVDHGGVNDFERWSRTLQKEDLARLNRKIKMLEDNGPNLGPKLLAGPLGGYAHIYKLRIRGLTELRPLLCKGPIANETEFTFLKGASEVGGKWVPASARNEAQIRRQEVINDAHNRRCPHLTVTK